MLDDAMMTLEALRATTPWRTTGPPAASAHAAGGSAALAVAAATPWAALAVGLLEQFDHGIVLLGPQGRVLHANRVALRELAGHGALRLADHRLHALSPPHAAALARALQGAARGLRTLLHFDGQGDCLPLVVLPLAVEPDAGAATTAGAAGPRAEPARLALAVLAKRGGTEPLNIELFAQAHGLTLAEQNVLRRLSRGLDPAVVAAEQGVALSTVRTHIVRIRHKTRTASLRTLLGVVNNLPPVVCAAGR